MNDTFNICCGSDSYKVGSHFKMMDKDTEYVYSYFESREDAKYDETVFFGLQYIIKKYLAGVVVTQEKIDQAYELCKYHFGNTESFNKEGWEYILKVHGGRLPIEIKAVPEGTPVSVSNVLMTVVNTDPKCFWLTNFLETILTHVFYSSTIATLSRETKKMMKNFLEKTSDNLNALPFMLHCFGYRSASSYESAGIGNAGHLLNFLGTDTIAGIEVLRDYYNAKYEDGIAFSVPATEHSIGTSLGKDGEKQVIERLLKTYPNGILSLVGDSYDIYRFVEEYICKEFKNDILNRKGTLVVRPDSITEKHSTPEALTLWIVETLWKYYGGTINSKGYKVLNPCIKALWGDGIDKAGVEKILQILMDNGFSSENMVFGMGSGLIQKGIHRDLLKFAFKSSAQCRNGIWHDVWKETFGKKSKRGRLKLIRDFGSHRAIYLTVPISDNSEDELKTVFLNGEITKEYNLKEIRENAKL